MKNRRQAVFIIFFCISVFVFLNYFNKTEGSINWAEEKGEWSERIERSGPASSYEELKNAYEDKNLILQHWAAHLFGGLLYEKTGLDGTTVCDDAYSFGCYHGFFSAVLADRGEEIISELDDLCVKKFGIYGTGCQHGIGHGLIEFFGRSNLLGALDVCSRTTQVNKRFGCTSGVFMEYNAPLLAGTEVKRDPKPFKAGDPYEPCPKMPEKYRESCYYELAQWWSQSGLDFNKIGELCGQVQDGDISQRSCYLGIANLPVSLSGDPEHEIPRRCGQMPDTWGQRLCLAGYKLKTAANKCAESVQEDKCGNGALLEHVNNSIDGEF